jgi:hypothetical protein
LSARPWLRTFADDTMSMRASTIRSIPWPTWGWLPFACLAVLSALGSSCASDSEAAMLPLLFPDDGAELSLDDDVAADERGLQVDVRAESRRLDADTAIELVIDGQTQPGTVALDGEGDLEIPSVTLPPGKHVVQVRTTTGSVASEAHAYVFRTLVIVSPEHGQSLQTTDDRDSRDDGLQLRVDVDVFEIDRDADILLFVDDEQVGDAVKASAAGRAAFSNVTLEPGSRTLTARVGGSDSIESEPVTVDVPQL